MKKNPLPNIFCGLALTAFTAYVMLDTFVLESTYQTDATEMNTSMFSDIETGTLTDSDSDETEETTTDDSSSASDSSSESSRHSRHRSHGKGSDDDDTDDTDNADNTDTSSLSVTTSDKSSADYSDDNISVTMTEYYENDTKIYVADIQLTSAQYLKTAFAQDSYGKNVTETTSSIASSHSAILAINGDYYGAQERGYVIRNGIVYRDTASDSDLLCIYADGTMKVTSQSEKTAQELVDEGVWQAFSFGPALVEDSQISVSQGDEVGKAMASNPRTAIGVIDSNHFVFVVADGRTSESAGLSLYELAEFMQNLGVTTAYNLDGGGSSTMYFNGEVVNNPTTNGDHISEREVSDIVYIG